MKAVSMAGLDGATLLGFLASLGVLEALHLTSAGRQPAPRLGWTRSATWAPSVIGASNMEEVVSRVLEDADGALANKVLAFRYVKVEKRGLKEVQSLAPPVAVLRAALTENLSPGLFGVAEMLGALMCESAPEEIPEGKRCGAPELDAAGIPRDPRGALDLAAAPTPFDFTSRNTQFLDQIKRIRGQLTRDAIVDELCHGVGAPVDRIMRWDALVDMPGALFERGRPMTRPAAEWLAFRGISSFPLVSDAGVARIAGLTGRRKGGELTWALWGEPLNREVIQTVLRQNWSQLGPSERHARGIVEGFTVSLRKDATGYDGAVSPSRPIAAAPRRDRTHTRLDSVEMPWDSLSAAEKDQLRLAGWQRAELDRRLDHLDARPEDTVPWKDVRNRLKPGP